MRSTQANLQPSLSNSLIFTISKFQIMKKTYIQPSTFAITLHHQTHLMEPTALNTGGGDLGGGITEGGGEGANTKGSSNIWDEEW